MEQQIPIRKSADEIFDPEWSDAKKVAVRKAYRDFFRKLPRKTRSELGKLLQ